MAIVAGTGLVVAQHNGPVPSRSMRAKSPAETVKSSLPPPEAVVWTDHFHIAVVSSPSGRLIRTLATDVGLYRGSPTPDVSNRGIVYFDDATRANGLPSEEIVSVPIAGGRATPVASGRDPALSPNGASLAYITYSDLTNQPEAIVVRDLSNGATRTWMESTNQPDIWSLSWAPDSRHLSFQTLTAHMTSVTTTYSVLDTFTPSHSLATARIIPLSSIQWTCYLTNSTGIGLVRRPDGYEFVSVDVTTGRTLRRLGALMGPQFAHISPGTVRVDPSGQYLLAAGFGSGYGGLYRLTIRTGRFVKINGNVDSAAWVP